MRVPTPSLSPSPPPSPTLLRAYDKIVENTFAVNNCASNYLPEQRLSLFRLTLPSTISLRRVIKLNARKRRNMLKCSKQFRNLLKSTSTLEIYTPDYIPSKINKSFHSKLPSFHYHEIKFDMRRILMFVLSRYLLFHSTLLSLYLRPQLLRGLGKFIYRLTIFNLFYLNTLFYITLLYYSGLLFLYLQFFIVISLCILFSFIYYFLFILEIKLLFVYQGGQFLK